MLDEELAKLARRIAWLDRFRRTITLVAIAILTPLMIWWFSSFMPKEWPFAHIIVLSAMLGAIVWYGLETLLGFVLALWETDYAKHTRRPELPRAELLRRKK